MPVAHPKPLPSPMRELLRRYAAAWAGSARGSLSGRSGDEELAPEILFVDGFAGADYPLPGEAAPVCARVAARLLEGAGRGGASSAARVALFEEDPAKVEWLAGTLRDGRPAAERRESGACGAPGSPLLLEQGEWTECAELAGWVREAREVLLLFDPPAAGKLPFSSLRALLEVPHAELLLRFPTTGLRRLARHRGSPLADLPLYAKRAAEGISRLLGDARHQWFFGWRAALDAGEVEAAERGVVAAYADRLRAEVGERVYPMEVPGGEAGPETLLLVSGRPSGAYVLSEILYALRCEGLLPWPEPESGWVRYPEGTELQLFAGEAAGARRERVVDRTLLAHSIAERFAGRTVAYPELLREVWDGELVLDDVRRALSELRREGRALFRSLSGDAELAFPRLGSRLRGVAGGRRRRPAPEEELSLTLEPRKE